MERMMSMCNIAVQIPEEVVYDTKMNITETQNFIKQQVALGYYVYQGVSIGYCAQIAGMTKEDFIKFLGMNNISIFKYDDENEFLGELNNA